MQQISVRDRKTGTVFLEKIYGETLLRVLYESRIWGPVLLPWIAGYSWFSRLVGIWKKSRFSRKEIVPFIQKFSMNTKEFLDSPDTFPSFNDFFIRKLRPDARPIHSTPGSAVVPADGRYLVYPDIGEADGFWVKGKKFSLEELLGNADLAKEFAGGAMVLARLCPTDYHRFHFPCACIPSESLLIPGPLYSVNPLALCKNIDILARNKREITILDTQDFGKVLYIEVGATCVGSIHQTFIPGKTYAKGEEKGYFSFGGSTVILLFLKGRIELDIDLVSVSKDKIETYALMGQSLGRACSA